MLTDADFAMARRCEKRAKETQAHRGELGQLFNKMQEIQLDHRPCLAVLDGHTFVLAPDMVLNLSETCGPAGAVVVLVSADSWSEKAGAAELAVATAVTAGAKKPLNCSPGSTFLCPAPS